MTLSFDQIKQLSLGAVRWEECDGCLAPRRFSSREQQKYRTRRQESYLRSFATAGIRLEFITDSETLSLKVRVLPSTSRRWFSHSLLVDGQKLGELSGALPEGETCVNFEKRFSLGPGRKRVSILFPWSVESRIQEIALDDGAAAVPVDKTKLLLSYGDSITQGYDAPSPEEAYIVRLADAMDARLICKAIGGERFWPELPGLSEVENPDLICVAYGTNDWSLSGREEFLEDSLGFFRALRQRYPETPVLALAPIWREDIFARERSVGAFEEVAAQLWRIAREVPGITVVDCRDFVPKSPDSFADLKLHPNAEGFRHYSENLLTALGLR